MREQSLPAVPFGASFTPPGSFTVGIRGDTAVYYALSGSYGCR